MAALGFYSERGGASHDLYAGKQTLADAPTLLSVRGSSLRLLGRKCLRVELVLSPRLKVIIWRFSQMNRHTVVFGGVFLVLTFLFGLFVVKGVRKADVVLIRQQQEQKHLQREHSMERQQEEEKARPAQQTTASTEQPTKVKAIEEEQLVWNRTHSDPAPPASTDNIKGEWWFSELTPNKTYMYVGTVGSGIVEGSLPDGRTMSLRCAVVHSKDSSSYIDDSPVCTGLSNNNHSWVRITMGSTFDAGSSASPDGWSLQWHEADVVEVYHIQSFCDPRCTSP